MGSRISIMTKNIIMVDDEEELLCTSVPGTLASFDIPLSDQTINVEQGNNDKYKLSINSVNQNDIITIGCAASPSTTCQSEGIVKTNC